MKTDRFLSLNILLLLSVILLFSCKKEEVTEPDDNYDLPLPVVYWERGSEINVYQDIIVDDFILFIDKGVNVRFMNGAKIVVGKMSNGAIIAVGTEAEPINFIPMPDTVQPDEYWNGIFINNNHPDIISTFEHCNFIKGCTEESDAVLNIRRGYISIKNCLFDYSKKYGVYLQSSVELVEFEDNIIKHTLDHPMVMSPSNVHKIGENNNFITDFKNKGIYLNMGSYKDTDLGTGSSGDDTIVWKAQTVPYIVGENLYFENGKVRICAGTIIAMNYSYSHIYVDINYFEAIGTAEEPIIFTSNKKVKKPGDWESLVVSNNAVFKNCIFEYGGYDIPCVINIGMINMGEIIDNFISNFVNFALSLSSDEIIILVLLTAVLILFIIYRWLGTGAVIALLIIYALAYILYANNIFDIYQKNEAQKARDNQILQSELNIE